MRIVVDLQGAQTRSRFRGIGRYSMSFTKALIQASVDHEIVVVLSGLFPSTIGPIREELAKLLPEESILTWQTPGPVATMTLGNSWRHRVAEPIREAFIADLQPDLVLITSFLEGYTDNAVASTGKCGTGAPVAVLLYDLIPLVNPKQYLEPYPLFKEYYLNRIQQLRKADLLLAISEFSRIEGIKYLDLNDASIVNISSAVDEEFAPATDYEGRSQYFFDAFSISRPFVLYTGGADDRKNLPALIHAFSMLPTEIRQQHQLVFAGKIIDNQQRTLLSEARSAGLGDDELILTGYVSDADLIQLYSRCSLFVFPSWHEGFGLPVLEAMACGAPVLGANRSSLPEVIAYEAALFNPESAEDISRKISRALGDSEFSERLKDHGGRQARLFSWPTSAKKAIDASQRIAGRTKIARSGQENLERLIGRIASVGRKSQPTDLELARIAACIDRNRMSSTRFLQSRERDETE